MSLATTDSAVIDVTPRRALTSADLDTLRRTICHNLNDSEFELFAAICRRTGLDPVAKQIYAVKRWDGRQKQEVMQVQTGIDGFRVIAERSGNYAGPAPTFWCGDDGVWVDVWLSPNAPAAAKAGVYRKDFNEPVYAVAKFSSYCATNKDGTPQAMWKTMPEVMIAKCAESLAIRRAFPNDVSGVYTKEEMGQQHNLTGPPLATPAHMARIDALLPQVPQDAMPTLKAWKAEAGISMKAGEFTAEMADDVIAKLEELAHSLPAEEPTNPTASAHGAGGGNDKGTVDGAREGEGETLAVPEVSGGGDAAPPTAVASPGEPAPTPLKAINESGYKSLNRKCRAIHAEHGHPDKATADTQWEALAWACSGARTVHLGELSPDEASVFRTRMVDVGEGRAVWAESDDPAWLGWTLTYEKEAAA